MKNSCDPNDELLHSLVEEANALPQSAAAEARARARERTNTVRIAAMLTVTVLALGVWFLQRTSQQDASRIDARAANWLESAKTTATQGYVKVHLVGEAVEPDAIPRDVSERERKLLTDLRGVPLLIVKNDAGQVTRVHIFER